MKAFSPRPKQQEVLDYPGGRMGVAAVPGSGKTWTLSRLAAAIVAGGQLADDQEVLVVTLVNSAVDNFYQRVSAFVEEYGILPHLNYRVRTLHGLAHDIVRERPELVGLSEDFQIIDERDADGIVAQASRLWLHSHSGALDGYLSQELDENQLAKVYRDHLPELLKSIGTSFIRSAKDKRLTPERLGERLEQLPVPLPLAQMGWEIYTDYQRSLAYRGSVDFQDLIRLALDALSLDEKLLERLRWRWPYFLEDEAQDSSQLQEEILRLLVGESGNWVRVGDPNQAIYETFTTANPRYLRSFISSQGVLRRELPNSGRSTISIIDLANHLVDWTIHHHPVKEVRDALSAPPFILPAPSGDPQPNPPDDPAQVHLVLKNYTADGEIRAVVDSLERWLPDHPQHTVAVLVPRNERADKVVDALERRKIEVVESLLPNTSSTRSSARALRDVLGYLADPGSSRKLAEAYQAWTRAGGAQHSDRIAELLRKCSQVEDFLWPLPGEDWLDKVDLAGEDPLAYDRLLRFRELTRRWQASVLLPVDQALLALAQDMFTETTDLAISHKMALLLRRASDVHPDWRLPDLTEEISLIARNERRFLGFHQDEMGFDPDSYPGKVVVATVHKAKGLEWDRVYLMSVNSYDFPSGAQHDQYISERWFIRDKLNLQAETLEQLDAVLRPGEYEWYQEGRATSQSRLDYVRERLRLLYVGITRARKELVITYNSGRKSEQGMARALAALVEYSEGKEIS